MSGDIRINTQHIVKNDVLFCFLNAEKYITFEVFVDLLKKTKRIYAISGFVDRILSKNECTSIDKNTKKQIEKNVVEVENETKLQQLLVKKLKKRYKLPKHLMAITGTKGKTSTAWFVMQMFAKTGKKCGYIGTLGAFWQKKNELHEIKRTDGLTTPFVDEMYRLLNKMQQNGCKYVIFEASSHALCQGRLDGLNVDVAGFTNFSQDHLDFHKTMDEYFNAKMLLFKEHCDKKSITVLNKNDETYEKIIKICKNKGIKTVCIGNENADLSLIKISKNQDGQDVELKYKGKNYSFHTKIIGEFQIENIMQSILFVISACKKNNMQDIYNTILSIEAPKGRMQKVKDSNIFVDFAHTPKSLKESLLLLNDLFDNVFVVFGCGGDRDKQKRPIMLNVAKKLADKVFLTSDNCRTEKIENIINDIICIENNNKQNELFNDEFVRSEIETYNKEILKNKKSKNCKILVENDRRKAIAQAVLEYKNLKSQGKNIALLIAGKGAEDYQIIGTTKYHFSDFEEVLKNL